MKSVKCGRCDKELISDCCVWTVDQKLDMRNVPCIVWA